MDKAQADALWDRINADWHTHEWWSGIHCAALSPISPLIQTLNPIVHEASKPLMVLGIPVRIDATLAPGEMRLEGADGALVRIINTGEDS